MNIIPLPLWLLLATICILALAGFVWNRTRKAATPEQNTSLRLIPTLTCTLLLAGTFAYLYPFTAHSSAKADGIILSTLTYTVCGDEAQLDGTWNTVYPDQQISTSAYSGPVNSYAGPKGYLSSSTQQCSGVFHWGWNQYYHVATWRWISTDLSSYRFCRAALHIPHWYAGASDTSYRFSIIPEGGTPITTGSGGQNEDHGTDGWYGLPFFPGQTAEPDVPQPLSGAGGTFPAGSLLPVPRSIDGRYALTLELTNGSTPNLYMGVDAARFTCYA